jgi:hypothetical protein
VEVGQCARRGMRSAGRVESWPGSVVAQGTDVGVGCAGERARGRAASSVGRSSWARVLASRQSGGARGERSEGREERERESRVGERGWGREEAVAAATGSGGWKRNDLGKKAHDNMGPYVIG